MSEIVYILTNESMPGYVKIGFTNGDIKDRLRSLDRTGTPLPFEVYYAAEVENAKSEEEWLHSIFADRRVRDNREFFKINPEYVALAMRRVEKASIEVEQHFTSSQEEEIASRKQRRSRFHFQDYGISIGDKLTFTRDPSIVATVAPDDKITINNKTDSLSNFAFELLSYKHKPQGTLYFKYQDEILDDLRRRVEENH